ncbi:CoA transferase [Hydrogenophaga laconesensis]|uniref:2-methylfumaryl-CoA isomerase n=1 Tax=Hydrogenophaga laconesensis TaxID=1805971 RepID=A0ABU1V6P7_9BURK|nr:CoA transferase [Hydrogenophaga laconesensis]MDR7093107.1 2-methylfumaryl-CoA isomerase [Hydrogenophaga laconesensis]
MNAILSGMRVVEAAAFVAAPLGGMTLAQMGADVIRIDPLGGGLDHKRWPVTHDDVSLFWCGLNKSKRSVALDLGKPEAREIAMDLITAPGEDAGILLTNFPPRGWLDHDKLRERRQDLIQLTVQGDRHGGSAVDYTINSRVGIPYITGDEGGAATQEAVNHVLPAWDLVTGQMAAVGLLAAERHRLKTGQGQHVKLPLEDVALAAVSHLGLIAEAQLGHQRERHGNELFGAFGRDFKTADGERLIVVGLTLKQWQAICEAMGLHEAVKALGERLGLNLDLEGHRFQARKELAALVDAWMSRHSFAQASEALTKQGACWGKYQTLTQLVTQDEACSTANPMFRMINQPGVGPHLAAGLPLNFSGMDRLPAGIAPALGQHTGEVLSELLGITQAQYGGLRARGIV